MSFISYAQNFEDVMLWRALKHIKQGFYIDIGAYSPDDDSVTKAFYDRGWSGINIEPNPQLHEQYLTKRERDINLKVAISDTIGETNIYFSQNAGLSSLDKNIAQSHEKIGLHVTPSKVTLTTLSHICQEYTKDKEIHFLKVDVEGLEAKVIRGNDWSKFRPWIVVVEATMPMSQVENHQEWEYILIEADYIFAYADGLNRFYISPQHQELLPSFKYPPNIFDDFIVAGYADSQCEAQSALIQLNEANARAQEEEQNAITAWQHYEMLIKSKSWKLTKPLRSMGDIVRWIRNKSSKKKLPQNINDDESLTSKNYPRSLEHLTPNAKKIYHELESTIMRSKKKA
jgi:FkbM family methyltransferase